MYKTISLSLGLLNQQTNKKEKEKEKDLISAENYTEFIHITKYNGEQFRKWGHRRGPLQLWAPGYGIF